MENASSFFPEGEDTGQHPDGVANSRKAIHRQLALRGGRHRMSGHGTLAREDRLLEEDQRIRRFQGARFNGTSIHRRAWARRQEAGNPRAWCHGLRRLRLRRSREHEGTTGIQDLAVPRSSQKNAGSQRCRADSSLETAARTTRRSSLPAMSKRPAFPRARDRHWGRAQFRRVWRRHQRLERSRERRRGRGLVMRIRRLLRRLFYVAARRSRSQPGG